MGRLSKRKREDIYVTIIINNIVLHFVFFFAHFYFPASGQAVVTGVVPSHLPVPDFNFYRA